MVCTRGELQRPPATVLRCARRLLTRDKALYQSCTYPALRLPTCGPLAAELGDTRRSHTASRAFSPIFQGPHQNIQCEIAKQAIALCSIALYGI